MAVVTIDQLANEIAKAMTEYTEDVSQGIGIECSDTADKVLMEVGMLAPHSDTITSGEYARSFVKTDKSLATHGYRRYVIWNKKQYRRVHLLEFGHAKVNGGRVKAFPHMIPAYDKYIGQFENNVEKIIKNGGRK